MIFFSVESSKMDDEKEYICNLCPKKFDWKADLVRHQVKFNFFFYHNEIFDII